MSIAKKLCRGLKKKQTRNNYAWAAVLRNKNRTQIKKITPELCEVPGCPRLQNWGTVLGINDNENWLEPMQSASEFGW